MKGPAPLGIATITLRGIRVGCICLLAAAGVACGSGAVTAPTGNTTPASNTTPSSGTAMLSFSVTATRGWSSIPVTVDGRSIGTLTAYELASSTASCVASSGRVVVTVAPGSHNYSASSDSGATWGGTAVTSAGGCTEVQLTCTNGNCAAAPPPPTSTPASISFQGSSSFRVTGNSVAITISRILNSSLTNTSGSLRIDLWATAAPYSGNGELSGYMTASMRTENISGLSDTLRPNSYFSNITLNLPYTAPPPGNSTYTLVVAQYSTSCSSADHFCLAAYLPLR
jgi:hypothetical protein